jgi:hypothetical protein
LKSFFEFESHDRKTANELLPRAQRVGPVVVSFRHVMGIFKFQGKNLFRRETTVQAMPPYSISHMESQ